MHYDNGLELLIDVVFAMSTQLGRLGTKSQELMIPFRLGEGEPLTYFHLRALTIRSELELMRYQIGKIKNLTGKYIMEL